MLYPNLHYNLVCVKKQSDLGLYCLSQHLGQATSVQNFYNIYSSFTEMVS